MKKFYEKTSFRDTLEEIMVDRKVFNPNEYKGFENKQIIMKSSEKYTSDANGVTDYYITDAVGFDENGRIVYMGTIAIDNKGMHLDRFKVYKYTKNEETGVLITNGYRYVWHDDYQSVSAVHTVYEYNKTNNDLHTIIEHLQPIDRVLIYDDFKCKINKDGYFIFKNRGGVNIYNKIENGKVIEVQAKGEGIDNNIKVEYKDNIPCRYTQIFDGELHVDCYISKEDFLDSFNDTCYRCRVTLDNGQEGIIGGFDSGITDYHINSVKEIVNNLGEVLLPHELLDFTGTVIEFNDSFLGTNLVVIPRKKEYPDVTQTYLTEIDLNNSKIKFEYNELIGKEVTTSFSTHTKDYSLEYKEFDKTMIDDVISKSEKALNEVKELEKTELGKYRRPNIRE